MMQPGSVKVVCKHWLAGFCRQGNTCIFLHEQPSDGSVMQNMKTELSEAESQAVRLHTDQGKTKKKKPKSYNSVSNVPVTDDATGADDFIEDFVDQLVSSAQPQYNYPEDKSTKRKSILKDTSVPFEKRVKRRDVVSTADEYQAQDRFGTKSQSRSTGRYDAGYEDYHNQDVDYPSRNSRVTPGRAGSESYRDRNINYPSGKSGVTPGRTSSEGYRDRNINYSSSNSRVTSGRAGRDSYRERSINYPAASLGVTPGGHSNGGYQDTDYLPDNARAASGRSQKVKSVARTEYPGRDEMQTMERSTYSADRTAFRKASQSISDLMFGKGGDNQIYPGNPEGDNNPSVNQMGSSMPGYVYTDGTQFQSSQVQPDAFAGNMGSLVQEQWGHPVQDQMGYTEYGSNVYMDANPPRSGGVERRQMAHINRGNQDGGSAATKYKNAKTDEELGIMPPREVQYGNKMQNFIVGFMKNAGKYKGGVLAVVKAYKLPANCVGLTPPKMNTDAWNVLTKKAQTRDEMLQDLQRWFATGLIPVVQQLDLFGKGSQIWQDVCRYTSDTLNTLAYVCSILSIKRRLLMRNSLHSKFGLLCRKKQPLSAFLFGDSLSFDLQRIKAGTYSISEAEKNSFDQNDIDPEAQDFKPTFFSSLALPEGVVDESVSNIVNMACSNDGDVSDLREKYQIPANVKSMIPPKINPEIWNLVSRSGLELDYRLQDVHMSIAEGMVPLMIMMQAAHDKTYDESGTLQLLTDSVLLLGNAIYQLNKVRMNAMRRSLPEHAQSSCGFYWPGADFVSLEALSQLSDTFG